MGIASTSQADVLSSAGEVIEFRDVPKNRDVAKSKSVSDESSASPLPAEVLTMVIRGWNSTYMEIEAGQTLVSLFDEQARKTPDAPALIFNRRATSYRELSKRANQIAHYMKQNVSVSRGDRVGVCIERSTDMVAVLLGILKTGAAYVPVDPSFPASRIEFMLEDSTPKLVVADADLPGWTGAILRLDGFSFAKALVPEENIVSPAVPMDPAYVVYTSGSTGRPKGVLGLHQGAINRFQWMWRKYPFQPGEICCQKTTLSFVDSVWEIFGPLLRGVPTVIFSAESVGNPAELVRMLATHNVSRMVLVPSLLRIILSAIREPAVEWPDLRICVTSGEAVPLVLVREFQAKFPNAKLLNLYGSSEVSADVTCFDCADLGADATCVPLGRPIDNTEMHIVSKDGGHVAVGEIGEICAGGVGLAGGYLNQPELTKASFVVNPFSEDKQAKLYRMGDLGRWLPDGNIEFRGRADHQIKIRGVRIEPGDIESALTSHESVGRAYVRYLKSAESERLIAYAKGDPMDAELPEQLMAHMRENLPSTMMPNFVIVLKEFPLTVNGKLDIQSLPTAPNVREAAGSAPTTDTEKAIAKLWAKFVGKEPTSAETSFFDMGGDSLGVMALAAAIDREFGRRVPLRSLLEKPTVGETAAWLDDPGNMEASEWSSIVAIRAKSDKMTKTPIFLVHGIGGGILWGYNNLAANLDEERPVYAFSSRGLDGFDEFDNAYDMAAQYIRDMKTVQPEGPYMVGGYCFGGNIAYEMCRQLRESGDEVALALIIDAYPFVGKTSGKKLHLRSPMEVFRFGMNFVYKLGYLLKMPARERSEHMFRSLRWIKWRLLGGHKNRAHEDEAATMTNLDNYNERQAALWAAHVAIHSDYVDGPISDTRLRLLRTRSQPVYSDYAKDFGWSKLAGSKNTRVRMLSGHHDFVFLEPNIKTNAKIIGKLLNEADPRIK
jgi:amino acid adenylation domain-containing protein